MDPIDVVRARVDSQLASPRAEPAAVVRAFGAVQAQDYRAALWGIALRTTGATEADVERAIAARTIVRTWPMRGTLHFVAPADVRWMLRLLARRVIPRAAARHRELGLDDAVFARARTIFERALAGDRQLTRPETFALLEEHGIAAGGQRGVHILGRLAMEGVLCFGPHRGKQPTLALLDEWVPPPRRDLDDDEALGELARRYLGSHGPATEDDLAWWSGLPLGEARRAIEIARHDLHEEGGWWSGRDAPRETGPADRAPRVDLLPPFDEYTVAYRERSAFLDADLAARTRNGIMSPVVLVDGRIAGVWSRARAGRGVRLRIELARSVGDPRAIEQQVERFGRFVELPATAEITGGGSGASP